MTVKEHLKANWKRYVMIGAGAVAAYYGGPAGRDAAYEYLPKVAHLIGL